MIGLLLCVIASDAPNLPRPNVVLVTIDTLRADRVGAYGHTAGTTPALDRLAARGVLLEEAVVQAPQTRPSHASLFTGRNPHEHGIRDNASTPLDTRWPTLAAQLRAAGYDTGAFVGAYPVSRDSGLDRGFATYDDPFALQGGTSTRNLRTERPAKEVIDRAVAWLSRPRESPFFLWAHLFDPHAPYEAPPPYAERHARNPYDAEVAYADAQVGRLLEWLETSGAARSTLVVVTSDHGEGLGDHGEDEHMLLVYDSTLRVPLLFAWPAQLPANVRVSGQFRSVDLLPTLLDLLGLAPVGTSGVSRAAVLRSGGRLPDNESYAESLYGQIHFGYAPLRALRAGDWKYIDAPRAELYDVRQDPGEITNRIADRAQVAAALEERLRRYETAAPTTGSSIDPAVAERLAALGYVGGGSSADAAAGADPKDKLAQLQAFQRDMRRGTRLYQRRELDAAIRLFSRLAAESGIDSFNVVHLLGRSLVERRRFAEAIGPLEKAAELSPALAPIYVQLALAYAGNGQKREAEQAVQRGLEKSPTNAELFQVKGKLLLREGRMQEARGALETALRLSPRDPTIRADLATLYRGSGDLARARSEAQAALAIDASSPDALLAWGLVLGAEKDEAGAAQAFRKALDQAPDFADALFYLASVEFRAGRPERAQPLAERLRTIDPTYPGAEPLFGLARRAETPGQAGRVRLLLIRVRDSARAAEIARRAAAGEDFRVLARRFSEDRSAANGGDLGVVAPSDMAEPLRASVAQLRPGQVSAPIHAEDGWLVVKRER